MTDLTIRNLIDRVASGDIRIPAFQRSYVWEADQVAFLIDSIYKDYPIGTIVFWQTDKRLKTEKQLGSFVLPEPKKEYPVNYVLDGQQRITSLFSCFQSSLKPQDNVWTEIYFDMDLRDDAQEPCFVALNDDDVDPDRHFPIKTFFETVAYRKATKELDDDRLTKIDKVVEKIKEYRIQNQSFEADDMDKVAIVFERINRAGTELDIFELLVAWSWSEEFDLIDKFDELQLKIREHGFEGLIEDRDLQLRICAAVITGESAPRKILELNGSDIRDQFLDIENGILGAIDFLKNELGVAHYNMLPFPGVLVPLSTFFATKKSDGQDYTQKQSEMIKKWFWRSLFTRRFSNDVSNRQALDISEMRALQKDESHQIRFPRFEMKINFETDRFSFGNANSKVLILMLANNKPKSFISGANVDKSKVLKRGTQTEFHHIFPTGHLANQGIDKRSANVLANICFLTRHDNNKIKAKSPSVYFDDISENNRAKYLKRAFCKYSDRSLEFAQFVEKRANRLTKHANKLSGTEELP